MWPELEKTLIKQGTPADEEKIKSLKEDKYTWNKEGNVGVP